MSNWTVNIPYELEKTGCWVICRRQCTICWCLFHHPCLLESSIFNKRDWRLPTMIENSFISFCSLLFFCFTYLYISLLGSCVPLFYFCFFTWSGIFLVCSTFACQDLFLLFDYWNKYFWTWMDEQEFKTLLLILLRMYYNSWTVWYLYCHALFLLNRATLQPYLLSTVQKNSSSTSSPTPMLTPGFSTHSPVPK